MTVWLVYREHYGEYQPELVEIFLAEESAEAYVKQHKEQYDLEHSIRQFEVKP